MCEKEDTAVDRRPLIILCFLVIRGYAGRRQE